MFIEKRQLWGKVPSYEPRKFAILLFHMQHPASISNARRQRPAIEAERVAAVMDPVKIVSERGRITLRTWSEDDADALFALASEPAVAEAAPFPVHGDRAESLRVIREVFCAPESYAIVSSADGGLLGCINVFPGIKGEDVYVSTTVKFGYWLGKPFWGRGFMTEAVTTLCFHCFHSGHFNCDRIVGLTSPGNLGSRRVMEKSGFRLVEANDNVCRYVLEGRARSAAIG